MHSCDICNGKLQHRKSTYENPYHYTECGLSNILLIDVDVYFCPECEVEVAEIPRPKGLHLLLAKEILMKPAPMTGEEFRFLRKEIEMKPKEFANLVGVDPKTVTNWENLPALSRQNDVTVRFVVAERLEQVAPVKGFIDLNLSQVAESKWDIDAEMAQLIETNTYLGLTSAGWEIGPPEI